MTLTRERALAQAHRANQELLAGKDRGPLHGIPYGAKDLLATRGIPTTWGAEPYREQVFDFDATVVRRLEEAGAVLVAKLAMVELAGGLGYNNPDASFTGPAARPGTPTTGAAVLGGSAAAVAAGLVPFAIGTETSGSILTPAAFCGVTGLRPTYGLVPRHGAMALCWTLDKVGPLARSAEDCALVLSAIAGPDPQDPPPARAFRYRGGPRGAPAPASPARTASCGTRRGHGPRRRGYLPAGLAALRDVANVEEDVPFPDFPYRAAVGPSWTRRARGLPRPHRERAERQLRAAADRVGGYAMMMTRAADYVDAMRARVAMRAGLDALLSRYNALVAPTRRGSPRRSAATSTSPRRHPTRRRPPKRPAHPPRSRPGTSPAPPRSRCRRDSGGTGCRHRFSSSAGPSPRRRSWPSPGLPGDDGLAPAAAAGGVEAGYRIVGVPFHRPRVKSGNGRGMLSQATDSSESSPGADQAAAS